MRVNWRSIFVRRPGCHLVETDEGPNIWRMAGRGDFEGLGSGDDGFDEFAGAGSPGVGSISVSLYFPMIRASDTPRDYGI